MPKKHSANRNWLNDRFAVLFCATTSPVGITGIANPRTPVITLAQLHLDPFVRQDSRQPPLVQQKPHPTSSQMMVAVAQIPAQPFSQLSHPGAEIFVKTSISLDGFQTKQLSETVRNVYRSVAHGVVWAAVRLGGRSLRRVEFWEQ